MKKSIIACTLILSITCLASAPKQAFTNQEIAQGTTLLNAKYNKLKALYGSFNPLKRQWFRPATQEQLNKRIAVAAAKGDSTLAAQISKQGCQNALERIIPHALWEYRATIASILAAGCYLRYEVAMSKLPTCPATDCAKKGLHKHVLDQCHGFTPGPDGMKLHNVQKLTLYFKSNG